MMRTARQHGARLVALALIVALWGFARIPEATEDERAALASRFAFTRSPLPELPGSVMRDVRPVHPSLQHISAWISSVGAAVALNDLDGDGLPNDVCSVDPRTDQVIVAPAPGTGDRYRPFALPITRIRWDATMAPTGCLPGDVNEDGRVDIVVYYWGRTPVAYLRLGKAMGPDAWAPRELVAGAERWYTNAATFADVDGDGHVDLVIGNYFSDGARILDPAAGARESMQHSMARAANGGGARFLLWKAGTAGADPDVRFEVAGGLPPEAGGGWTLAVAAADLDGDLLPEIYLGNDFGPDRLLHNRSTPGRLNFALVHGRRTLGVPASKVLGRDSFKGMGVDFADVNGDGVPDIYVSNIAAEYALEESHFLFVSEGAPARLREGVAPWVDRSEPLGVSRSGWAWDAKLADFDNDGTLEAMQATGFVRGSVNRWPELHELAMGNDELLKDPRSWPRVRPGDDLSGRDLNPFFVRGGAGRYVDVARLLGFREPQVSRGIAIADVDGDGRLDLAVANQWGPSSFYRNQRPGTGAFLGLHLLLPLRAGEATSVQAGHPGAAHLPGRPAIGAAIAVRLADGRRLVAQVDGGNGHSGKRSSDIHVGLGRVAAGSPLPVDVAWRDPAGVVHRETLNLTPGWHTVRLGWARGR